MVDKNYTHILVIVDRSGSMHSIRKDMIGGLDAFFKTQAEIEGKCLVDYVQFDSRYDKVFEDTLVADAKAVLEPRGSTALLDAIGKGVTQLGKKLDELPEAHRPGLVQVVVVTDGYENSSREWTAESVKSLIKQQEEDYSWDFVFLGANMDAVAVGQSFGFSGDKSLTYNIGNVGAASATLSGYTTRSRLSNPADNAFTSAERDAQ